MHVQPMSKKDKQLLVKFGITQNIVITLAKLPTHPTHPTVPNKKQYRCTFCPRNCKNNANKRRHEMTCKKNPKQSDAEWVQKQKRFKCTMCNFSSAQKSHLQVHFRTHTGEKPFPCSLCKKCFRRRGDLRNHIFTHTGEKSLSCSFCDKGFFRKTSKICHEKSCKLNPKHNDKDWVEAQLKYRCDTCTYRAKTKSNLTRHARIHTGNKPFGCSFCSKHFITRGELSNHLRTHTREKPFQCRTCDYSTTFSSALAIHVGAVHRKEIRFSCSICSKGFYKKSDFNRHSKKHTGEKTYSCQFCNKCLTQNYGKTLHEQICKLNPKQNDKNWVDRQKKFKCNLCGYASTRLTHRAKHSQTHSGNQRYKCSHCGIQAATSKSMKSHRKIFHSERK